MSNLFDLLITQPLGWILCQIYTLTNSYGLAIILFTLIIRILLLPLAIKQQKSLMGMQKLQPLLAELQAKYKDAPEKLNEETLKLYKAYKVNPFGGCFPLLIQLPILFGLYSVIRRPLTYILNISKEQIMEIATKLNIQALETFEKITLTVNNITQYELIVADKIKDGIDFIRQIPGLENIHAIDFNFLYMNLAIAPNKAFDLVYFKPLIDNGWILILLPVLAGLTTYFTSKISSSGQTVTNEKAGQTQKTMMVIFPFMTAYFCYTLPAGMGIYWIASNVFQIVQQYFLNKLRTKKSDDSKGDIVSVAAPKIIKPKKKGRK